MRPVTPILTAFALFATCATARDPGAGAIVGTTTLAADTGGGSGATMASRRYMEHIEDMGQASAPIMRLRPVTFRYRKQVTDAGRSPQFGLVAEEVADAMPLLVTRNDLGQSEAVKYEELPVLLLNELQRVDREKRALEEELRSLRREIAELRTMVRALGSTDR